MSLSTELRVKELLREKGWTTKVLAEKTGMSESYLTHIKNGTRRWNEDALRKLANAFELSPVDLFSHRKKRTDDIESYVKLPEKTNARLELGVIPVVGDLPVHPSPYNNQIMQITTGFKDVFVPFLNGTDLSMFALWVDSNALAPVFAKNDLLVVSPELWLKSGDIGAIEYGFDNPKKGIMKVNYADEFIVLSPLNTKDSPVVLVRGKDYFKVIGKVIQRVQNFGI